MRGPDGGSTIAGRAQWLRGSSHDRSCGSRRPSAQAAAVDNSRKRGAFPRVGKGGASSALSGIRATPARAWWLGWVCFFVRSLAITRPASKKRPYFRPRDRSEVELTEKPEASVPGEAARTKHDRAASGAGRVAVETGAGRRSKARNPGPLAFASTSSRHQLRSRLPQVRGQAFRPESSNGSSPCFKAGRARVSRSWAL
ncbi:hypothetical protein LEMLEM_LOCUS25296 [Lemmus lemmus]